MPGVYWFRNATDEVIYVGKAKNLKHRVKSYTLPLGAKTVALVNEAKKINWQVTDSELDAILTEAELIRTYQPRYNRQLKDDKSPLYIYITNETFPRVLTCRGRDIREVAAETKTLFGPFMSGLNARQILKIARKLFPFCNAPRDAKTHRACFYYHLGLCPGVCLGHISIEDYRQTIVHLRLFLRGKRKILIQKLETAMKAAATQKDFEQASTLRDQIRLLTRTVSLRETLDLSLPTLHEDVALDRLSQLSRLLRHFISLPATYSLERIETYDISNLQGSAATGAMVVSVHGHIDKNEYRHFAIKSLNTPDDPRMIREMVQRRFQHPEWPMPNLVVVDGGRTQIRAARAVTPQNIPVVGLAKNPDRLVFINNTRIQTYVLKPNHPSSQILQQLRDEAHRFSRRLHHHRIEKELLQ